jgi:hypothetical protein
MMRRHLARFPHERNRSSTRAGCRAHGEKVEAGFSLKARSKLLDTIIFSALADLVLKARRNLGAGFAVRRLRFNLDRRGEI